MMEEVITGLHGRDQNRLEQELNACRSALENIDAVQQTFWKKLRMGIVIHDTDTAIVASNAVAQDLLGLTEDRLTGRTAVDSRWCFVREDGAQMPIEDYPVNIVLRTGKSLENYIVGVVRSDSESVVWGLVNAAPTHDRAGNLSRVVVTFVDISDRKRAEERLRLLSEKDSLTELPNRRFFADILDREWRLGVRYGLPVSLVMIDIDFFKAFNDYYGHLAGDECLISVSNALSCALKRPTDFLARYGGEEFVLLLQNTDRDGAQVIAEELRHCIERLRIPHAGAGSAGYVTVSLGIASMMPGREDPVSDLLLAADNALYRAKYLGKNQVVSTDT